MSFSQNVTLNRIYGLIHVPILTGYNTGKRNSSEELSVNRLVHFDCATRTR